MDKNVVIAKYKSHPDVQNVLNMIREDKNWVYDLFDLVKQIVFEYFDKTKLQLDQRIDELRKNIVIQLFGIFLLKISKSKKTNLLYNFIPMNEGDLERIDDPNRTEPLFLLLPIGPGDFRSLNRIEVTKAVNEYLIILESFIRFIEKDRKASIEKLPELFEIFTKRIDKENDLMRLVSASQAAVESNSGIVNTSPKVVSTDKPKIGRKPTYKTKDDLLSAISKVPKSEYNSKVKLAKLLGMSEGNLRRLLKEFKINMEFN